MRSRITGINTNQSLPHPQTPGGALCGSNYRPCICRLLQGLHFGFHRLSASDSRSWPIVVRTTNSARRDALPKRTSGRTRRTARRRPSLFAYHALNSRAVRGRKKRPQHGSRSDNHSRIITIRTISSPTFGPFWLGRNSSQQNTGLKQNSQWYATTEPPLQISILLTVYLFFRNIALSPPLPHIDADRYSTELID